MHILLYTAPYSIHHNLVINYTCNHIPLSHKMLHYDFATKVIVQGFFLALHSHHVSIIFQILVN